MYHLVVSYYDFLYRGAVANNEAIYQMILRGKVEVIRIKKFNDPITSRLNLIECMSHRSPRVCPFCSYDNPIKFP